MRSPGEAEAPRRPVGRIVVAALFVLLAINALAQVAQAALGRSGDPLVLTLLQFVIGVVALAAAWGSWSGAPWSPAAALLYGVVTGGMLAWLPWLLGLPRDAWGGIVTGAVAVLLVSLALAWYLRGSLARRPAAR